MSRRRQFDQPEPVAHGYWPHSDPEPADAPHGDRAPVTDLKVPSSDDPCPGPCNREFRAAELEHGEGNHDVVFHPGRPVWCVDVTHVEGRHVVVDHHGCTENILRDLRAIPDLAANLTPGTLNTPRDIRADDRGMGSSGMVHPPTNSPAWDTADELIRWALSLEGLVRARLGHEPTSHQKWHTLNDAIRYLLTYPTALLADPATAERVGRSIRSKKRALEQNTGRDRLIHRLPGTCMACDRKGLQRADGGELVQCRHCGASWAWDAYERLSKAYADDVRRRGA